MPDGRLARLALIRAVLNHLPIARPFLAPFEGALATLADLGGKSIFDLCLHLAGRDGNINIIML